jgi:hypothetical protein
VSINGEAIWRFLISVSDGRPLCKAAKTIRAAGQASLHLLDSERSHYAAQDALVQCDQTVSLDLVQLDEALRGGWQEELKTVIRNASRSRTSSVERDEETGGPTNVLLFSKCRNPGVMRS